ncbi:MAG: hypothetical protein LBV43_08960 [Prevotella sp.]|jgi:hypothetical protein|nr:hypothetical protein [Prevotella sp.]
MKTKYLFFAILICTSIVLGFSSCSDDDNDDIYVNSAETVATDLKFEDTNMKAGEIAGELTWAKPILNLELSSMVIYASADGQNKDKKLGEVVADKEAFTVEATDYVKYLLVVSKSKDGLEGQNFAKVEITDVVGNEVVTNLTFEDTNHTDGKVGGKVTWRKPTGHTELSKIIIYLSEDGIKKTTKLGEVNIDVEEFAIADRDYFNYLIVVATDKENKEVEDFAKIEVKDIVGGLYILNSGKFKGNNSNLAYYDLTTKSLSKKIFQTINGKGLGDTGQDIIVYGSKMYIAVYGSGIIYVTDKSGKILKEIESYTTESEAQVKQQPRRFTTYDGKVYVTYYNGYLAKIDTTELKIENQVKVGSNPEYVCIAKNKFYVANSAGMSGDYGKTLSIVDIASFKEDKQLTIPIENPERLTVDSKGFIYLISNGNYGDVKNTLQRIDPNTEESKIIGNATNMTLLNDKLYTYYAQWGDPNITFKVYDTATENNMTGTDFISDGTIIKQPYSITSDPVNNYIYIANSDYTNNGDMYIFNTEGKLVVDKFDTDGINPLGAYYVARAKK